MGKGPSIAEDTFSRLRVSFAYRSSTQSSLGGVPGHKSTLRGLAQYFLVLGSSLGRLLVTNDPGWRFPYRFAMVLHIQLLSRASVTGKLHVEALFGIVLNLHVLVEEQIQTDRKSVV